MNAEAVSADAPAPKDRDFRGPVIWFEIEDFLRFFDLFEHPDGIPRVNLELLPELHRIDRQAGGVRFCRLSVFTGRIEPIDFATVRAVFSDPPAADAPWRLLRRAASDPRLLPQLLAKLRRFPRYVGRLSGTIVRDVARAIARRDDFGRQVGPGDVVVCLGNSSGDSAYCRHMDSAKRAYGIRFCVLIHDIIPAVAPDLGRPQETGFQQWLADTVSICDVMFAVSAYSRATLLDYGRRQGWRVPPVEVLRLGNGFSRQPSMRAIRTALFPERFVMFVSTLNFRKNHRLLVQVWRRLVDQHGSADVPPLLFIGRLGWRAGEMLADIKADKHLDGKIIVLTDVSDSELQEAYRRCLFTLYPSLYEGWGFPVAESLGHGKFCVASNRTSLPEAGGEFADYFDPADEDDAVAKIERALFEPGYLAAREARIREAYRPPGWEDCAQRLIAALDRRFAPESAPRAVAGG